MIAEFKIRKIPFLFDKEQGITLLLVVVLLSALLTISVGIFNVVFGQILISGEVSDSFRALYAADEGLEKLLYRDRVLRELCAAPCTMSSSGRIDAKSGGCYEFIVTKTAAPLTTMKVTGEYRCAAPSRVVRRSFEVEY